MDAKKMLDELYGERDRLEAAIMTVERLARGQGKRRGRPPKWMSELKQREGAKETANTGRKRRKFSAETRKRMAESQKKRWATARGGKAHAAHA